jgi:multiple sugar transport system permease protein
MTLKARRYAAAYIYLSPAVVVVVGLIIYPMIYNVWLGFSQVPIVPGAEPEFVGFENYTKLLRSSAFRRAFVNSFVFTGATVVGSISVGLLVALVANESFRARAVVKVVALLPYAAPVIGTALIWKFMLHPTFGIINYLLVDVFGLLSQPVSWTNSPNVALPSVIVFDSWRYFPFAFLFCLAGLQRIPRDYYEAATLDGASVVQRFWYITLPELRFILATIFLLRWIWNFNKFTDIYLFTTTVDVLPVFLYQRGFQAFDLGTAAAVANILVILLLAFAMPFTRKVLKI